MYSHINYLFSNLHCYEPAQVTNQIFGSNEYSVSFRKIPNIRFCFGLIGADRVQDLFRFGSLIEVRIITYFPTCIAINLLK